MTLIGELLSLRVGWEPETNLGLLPGVTPVSIQKLYRGEVQFLTRSTKETGMKELFCNRCGQSLEARFGTRPDSIQNYGLEECRVSGAYCSPALEDGITYKFSLCEHCLKWLMDSFLIPADEKEYLI